MDNLDWAKNIVAVETDNLIAECRRMAQSDSPSREDCLMCGEEIPEARRKAVPGCTLCVDCKQSCES